MLGPCPGRSRCCRRGWAGLFHDGRRRRRHRRRRRLLLGERRLARDVLERGREGERPLGKAGAYRAARRQPGELVVGP